MKKLRVVLSVMMAVMVLVSSVYVYSAEATEAESANTEVEEIADVAGETDTETEEISKNEMSEDENIDNKEENNDATENNDVADENIDNSEESEDESKTDDKNEKTQKEIVEEKILELGYVDDVKYTYFEPENGFIGEPEYYGKDEVKIRAKIEETTLLERITFTGEYEENECEIESLGIAKSGDKLTCIIEHYATSKMDFYVLYVSGSKGTLTRYYDWGSEKRVTAKDTLKLTPYNGFIFYKSVEFGMGYNRNVLKAGSCVSTINIRGGVKNDEIIELWTEFACAEKKNSNAGIIRCKDIKYEVFDDYDIYCERSFLTLFAIEYNSILNTEPGVPSKYQRKTKEEQIEEHGSYYGEDGVVGVLMHTGTLKGIVYEDARIDNTVEFTIGENVSNISSNGKTDFTLYEISVLKGDEEGEREPKREYETLLKVEGNLGKKIYLMGSKTWKIPEGSKVYGREFLDGNSSYYTWSEVGEITDEYFEIIGGRGTEAASMTFHFSDDKRTGIDDIDFDFNGTRCTVAYDNLDYKGPFLSYFLYDLDNWQEMAKSFGLTPVKRGE